MAIYLDGRVGLPLRLRARMSKAPVDGRRKAVNTAAVKTTFDLPDALVRKAKALAAQQGRPLRDLVADAIGQKLESTAGGETDATKAREVRREAWERWKSRLERRSDGTWFNPEGIDDESFFQSLEETRREPWTKRDPFGDDA